MVALKKVPPDIDTTINANLRDKIKRIIAKTKDREAMLEDFHLIEAALATDRTVVSRDETVRNLFATASSRIGELKNIIWVNPDKP